jgi:DNA-binding response OmpR family regulator
MNPSVPSRRARVLLVDADEGTRATYAAFLKLAGFDAIEVPNGDNVANTVVTLHIGVVVIDLRLRGAFDGFEVTRRLRRDERTQSIPVIVLAATVDDRTRALAYSANCDLFLTNPCAPAALAREIRLLLAERGVNPDRIDSPTLRTARRAK